MINFGPSFNPGGWNDPTWHTGWKEEYPEYPETKEPKEAEDFQKFLDKLHKDYDKATKPKDNKDNNYNIYAEEGSTVIELSIPGFGKEDVKVHKDGNFIVVEGTSPFAPDEADIEYKDHNFDIQDFVRKIKIKENFKVTSVTLKNGFMTIVTEPEQEDKLYIRVD